MTEGSTSTGANRKQTARQLVRVLGAGLLVGVSIFHVVYSLHRSQASGFVDFPIFAERAATYLQTGELYPGADDLSNFDPAAAVYKYPPFYAALLLPFVADGVTPWLYTALWVLLVGVYLSALAAGILLLRGRHPWRIGFVFVLLALNFEPLFETLWHLQAELPFLLLLILIVFWSQRGRDIPLGIALGFAAALKIYPIFLLGYFILKRRFRVVASCAVTLLASVVFSLIVIDPGAHATYYFKLLPFMLQETSVLIVHNLGLGRYLQELFELGPLAAKRIVQVVSLGLLAFSVVAVQRNRGVSQTRRQIAIELSLFITLMLLVMPNCWSHYQTLLLLPFFALAADSIQSDGQPRAVIALAVAAYGLTLFYTPCADLTNPFPCAQTPFLLGLFQAPRPFHDEMVYLKVLANVLLWSACLLALWKRRGSPAPVAPLESD